MKTYYQWTGDEKLCRTLHSLAVRALERDRKGLWIGNPQALENGCLRNLDRFELEELDREIYDNN
jgi:hypothetical protein